MKSMLCSDCNKNAAILFFEKQENGKSTMEGLCAECAQKRGIDVIDVLNRQKNIIDSTKQDQSKW
jgi:protein-arginine kinase activator protein McsA